MAAFAEVRTESLVKILAEKRKMSSYKNTNTIHSLKHVPTLKHMRAHMNTSARRYSAACHFCIERLTVCMSGFSPGKRAVTDQAATESLLKENHARLEKKKKNTSCVK